MYVRMRVARFFKGSYAVRENVCTPWSYGTESEGNVNAGCLGQGVSFEDFVV